MSNKTLLQTNNINLQEILQLIEDLSHMTTLNETTVTCPSYDGSNLWNTGHMFTWIVIG